MSTRDEINNLIDRFDKRITIGEIAEAVAERALKIVESKIEFKTKSKEENTTLDKEQILKDLCEVISATEKESYTSTDMVSLAERRGYKVALLDVAMYLSSNGNNCQIIERTRWKEFLQRIGKY